MRATVTRCENEIELDTVGTRSGAAEEDSAGKTQRARFRGEGWRKVAERQTQQKKGDDAQH